VGLILAVPLTLLEFFKGTISLFIFFA